MYTVSKNEERVSRIRGTVRTLSAFDDFDEQLGSIGVLQFERDQHGIALVNVGTEDYGDWEWR